MTARLNVAAGIIAVTKSDTLPLSPSALAIFAQGAGDITLVDSRGVTTTITVTAGQVIQCRVKKVLSAGTTATNIFAYVGDT